MIRIFITFFLLHILFFYSFSQKEDYIWLMGRSSNNTPTPDSMWTPFQYNFNRDPMVLEYTPKREWDFSGMNTSICNEKGKLYCYSNGMFIVDSTHQWMEGGEKISYNSYWENNKQKLQNGKYYYPGYLFPQGNIFLTHTATDSILHYFGVKYYGGEFVEEVIYCRINKKFNEGKGKVEIVDSIIIKGSIKDGGLQATRHANGRDWWLIVQNDTKDTFYTFYINPYNIKLWNKFKAPQIIEPISFGTNIFSPQGDKYASINARIWGQGENKVLFMDFDRTTGLFSNPKYDSVNGMWGDIGYSVVFSHDGRYFYANDARNLYRYDLSKNDFPNNKELVAEYDGFSSYCIQDSSFCALTTFGFWQYGPDGKLYNVSEFGSARHMHRMNYPDEEDPGFEQHAIFTPNNPWTIPNFPNFRLGPLDGSPADTLGLDNHPIAKFRYEQDTTNHLNVRFTDLSYFRPETWHWDFGDGTTFEDRKPYWHEFPKNGTYNVCLTVSNENSEHTMCRQVTIGSTSTLNLPPSTLNYVSLFPNPTEGEVLLTVSDYIPEHGVVYIYNMMGREVFKDRIFYGWNSIDISSLPTGQYLYEVKDNTSTSSVLVGEGKLIKI